MTRIERLIATKRRAQIARMEGRPGLAAVLEARAGERLTEVTPPPSLHGHHEPSAGLYFTHHARKRMGQRGMRASDVYLIWTHGEAVNHRRGRVAYRVTRNVVDTADGSVREQLRRWSGAVIVVKPPQERGHRPALVTVMAFGEDTRLRW